MVFHGVVRYFGHYLCGESYNSDMDTLRPAARLSIMSILGMIRPDRMSDMVDFGSLVIYATCRTVNFLSCMISFSKIFMYLILSACPLQGYR